MTSSWPGRTPRAHTVALVAPTSPVATSISASAAAASAATTTMASEAATAMLRRERRQMSQNLLLELVERLPEGRVEVAASIHPSRERPEILHHAVEPVTRDEIVREQVRELVGRLRAVAQVAHGEAAWGAEGGEVESARRERPVRAHDIDGDEPAPHDAVQTQP